MGAHPSTDTAGITFFGVGENREQIPLGTKSISRDFNTPLLAEVFTESTAPAKILIYYNLASSHYKSPDFYSIEYGKL